MLSLATAVVKVISFLCLLLYHLFVFCIQYSAKFFRNFCNVAWVKKDKCVSARLMLTLVIRIVYNLTFNYNTSIYWNNFFRGYKSLAGGVVEGEVAEETRQLLQG